MWGIPWQIVVLLSGALSAASQALGKRIVSKYSAFQIEFWRAIGSVMVIGVFWAGGASVYQSEYFWWIVANGVVAMFSMIAYLSATREDLSGASVFAYSLSQIFIVVLAGILFGEWRYFDVRNIQGVMNSLALVLIMVSFVMYSSRKRKKSKYSWSGLLVLASVVNVVGNLFVKHVLNQGIGVIEFQSAFYLGNLVGGGAFLILRKKKILLDSWQDTGISILVGVMATVGVLVYLAVMRTEPLSLVSMVRRVATVLLTIGAGLVLFKEKEELDVKSRWSLVMGVLAFLLVMVGNR